MEAEASVVQPEKDENKLTLKRGMIGVGKWIGTLIRKFFVATIMGFAITPFFDLFLWMMRQKMSKKK